MTSNGSATPARQTLDPVVSARLTEHLRVLCDEIGARPAASRPERRAAEYVRQILETTGIDDVRDQFFPAYESSGGAALPLTLLATVTALFGGTVGKLVGGAGLLAAALGLRDLQMAKLPPFAPLIAQATSQNVIARLAPAGELRRRVFLIAHLDTNKQRYLLPQPVPQLTKPFNTVSVALAGLTGASMILDALTGRRRISPLQVLMALTGAAGLAALIYDEAQPWVEGANDNASAVAVLLALAETLRREPLAHTEVNLLFTGCEESGAIGMEYFLREYAPPVHNSWFIDLEMVGSGRLCYVTKHGVSHLSEYRPSPRLTALAAAVAREHTALRVTGRDMVIIDEVAPLVRRGYEAICIAGYDDQGYLPNWHRSSDVRANIEPDTLTRAAQYTYALITALDAQA